MSHSRASSTESAFTPSPDRKVVQVEQMEPGVVHEVKGEIQDTSRFPYVVMYGSMNGNNILYIPKSRSVQELASDIERFAGKLCACDSTGLQEIVWITKSFLTLQCSNSGKYVHIYNLDPFNAIRLCYHMTGKVLVGDIGFLHLALGLEYGTIRTKQQIRFYAGQLCQLVDQWVPMTNTIC